MNNIATLSEHNAVPVSVLCHALEINRADYYRNRTVQKTTEKSANPTVIPANKLSPDNTVGILNLMHSEEFYDCTPYQIFYNLLDKGEYYCSIRTMYRLLEQRGETHERRYQRKHRDAVKPELIAVRPNEVWSWDITKLLSMQRLTYYYLYVILDIYSRYVVGWMLAEKECQHLARRLIQKTALRQGIQPGQLTLHADNGASMRSGTVAELLEYIGVTKSHNRPYVSNDNPFSESQFKTLKYCPQFPTRFNNLNAAEIFCQQFFEWYNHQHYHSGIHYLKPHDVHYDRHQAILEKRHHTLLQAFYENPVKFNNRIPQIKVLKPVYINPPKTVHITDRQKEQNMV